MGQLFLMITFVISFVVTLLVLPGWIKRAKFAGLTGKDVHKIKNKLVAEMGGLPVLIGFVIGVLSFVGINTFILETPYRNLEILALLSTILLVAVIGIVDDILGWKIGLRQWQKPLLTLIAAFPMMVINAGYTQITLPFIGLIDLVYFYPLIVVSVGIIGASNGFNMVAGYNGLEAGMGMIILTVLALVARQTGTAWIAIINLCMVFSLYAFYLYNRYPAKVFPGDTLTYSVGALIACSAILANMEKVALVMFIPYLIQLPLKLRGKMQKESFASVRPDGTLKRLYNKIYAIEHLVISFWRKLGFNVTERGLVYTLFMVEFVLSVFVLTAIYSGVGFFG